MCLHRVTKQNPKKEGYGWKVFEKTKCGGLVGQFYNGAKFKEGVWNTDKNPGVIKDDVYRNFTYPAGFHIYKTRQAARVNRHSLTETVRKVRYKEALVEGELNDDKVIVARKIFIFTTKETR